MGRDLLRLYHRLPSPARRLVVRLRGEYLRRWRYGAETDALVADAVAREQWTPVQWQRWQEEQLARVLDQAARRVPYYRDHWSERRRRGDRSSPELLSNWPLTEKEAVRTQPTAFLLDGAPRRGMFAEHTSGSTGKPLDLWWGRTAMRQIFALNEAYCHRWYGVSRRDPWAMLGGQLVVPVSQTTPPFWVWNGALRQLYMSSYHLAPAMVPSYCDALVRHRVRFIAGYTSSLYQLALAVLDHGRTDLHLAVAFTHAEALAPHQREAISAAFHCPVCETYGNAEAVSRASACRLGTLHLWPQVGVTEILEDGAPVPAGESGEIVCTSLANPDMPLIRYRLGDSGSLGGSATPCGCGRGLPVLASVDGRVEDTLFTRDGRPIQRFHAVFIGVPGVREAQVVQESLDRIVLRCVTTPGFDAASRRLLVDKLHARMGPVTVAIEELDEIPRQPNGKFKAVVSRMPPHERPSLPRRTAAGQ